jgi:hypothetical protein
LPSICGPQRGLKVKRNLFERREQRKENYNQKNPKLLKKRIEDNLFIQTSAEINMRLITQRERERECVKSIFKLQLIVGVRKPSGCRSPHGS